MEVRLELGPPSQDTVTVFRSRSKLLKQAWYWRRRAGNGKMLSRSSEGYASKTFAVLMATRCNADKPLHAMAIEGGLADVDMEFILSAGG